MVGRSGNIVAPTQHAHRLLVLNSLLHGIGRPDLWRLKTHYIGGKKVMGNGGGDGSVSSRSSSRMSR